MSVLLVGNAGKTKLAATAPHPLFIDIGGGMRTIADKELPFISISSSEELLELKRLLMSEEREKVFPFPIETIVIDSVDELQKLLWSERNPDAKEVREFGLGDKMRAIVRAFRLLDLHVVMTCRERDIADGNGWVPALLGWEELPPLFDLVAHIGGGSYGFLVATAPTDERGWIRDRTAELEESFHPNFVDDLTRMFDRQFDLPASTTFEVGFTGSRGLPVGATPKRTQITSERLSPPAPSATDRKENVASPEPESAECSQCGVSVDEEQADISQIRFRRTLCKSCFAASPRR